jgi:hypothetical protein
MEPSFKSARSDPSGEGGNPALNPENPPIMDGGSGGMQPEQFPPNSDSMPPQGGKIALINYFPFS